MCRGQQRAPHTRGHGKRRSIFTTVPAVSTRGVAVSACPALRAYSDATNHISVTTSPSIAPHFHTPSSVRLHRTMSLCGTPRVCVPECPPLGRPSYNKVGPYQKCVSKHKRQNKTQLNSTELTLTRVSKTGYTVKYTRHRDRRNAHMCVTLTVCACGAARQVPRTRDSSSCLFFARQRSGSQSEESRS